MKHCVLVPHYCHVDQLRGFLPDLAAQGLPIYVVDDGSPEPVKTQLRGLLSDYAGCELIELPENAGKGAATLAGLRVVREHGFTHAFSVDADGQHDAADVPVFLERSSAEPEAILSGRPIFGADIPAARLHGRKITNTLAKVATWSMTIEDAMCGYRVYPVDLTLAIGEQLGHRRRMEFDIEVLVRAVWRGVPVIFVPTHVQYPADGASHFRMVLDNARLTLMHITLLLGGILRSPKLLWRTFSR